MAAGFKVVMLLPGVLTASVADLFQVLCALDLAAKCVMIWVEPEGSIWK